MTLLTELEQSVKLGGILACRNEIASELFRAESLKSKSIVGSMLPVLDKLQIPKK